MAKAKRDPRTGRFQKANPRKRAATKRKAPVRRRTTTARKAAPRRRTTYRRNPAKPDIMGMFMGGTTTAAQVLVGKAAARSVPDLMSLPKEGNTGLAVQAAVAVAIGYLADMFLPRDASAAILAGGLTAPLETLIVANKVPWLSDALSPTTAQAEVGAYVSSQPPALQALGAYPRLVKPRALGAYVEDEYQAVGGMYSN